MITIPRCRLSEKSFVLFFQYPPDEGRPLATSSLAQPLRGLTYSTLKLMTCGKSNHDDISRVIEWKKTLLALSQRGARQTHNMRLLVQEPVVSILKQLFFERVPFPVMKCDDPPPRVTDKWTTDFFPRTENLIPRPSLLQPTQTICKVN